MISILIVDDHPVVRDGLRGMLETDRRFRVVAEAGTGDEAVQRATELRPDVVLMDLRMPTMDGVDAIRELARRGVPSRVLVLTTYDTDGDVLRAIEAGATGYLLKEASREELVRAVVATSEGHSALAATVATRLVGQMRQSGSDTLSQREREVLDLIADGATNREAAQRLFVSEATIKTHLLHVYGKLGVNDRAAAVAVAYSRGYLAPRG